MLRAPVSSPDASASLVDRLPPPGERLTGDQLLERFLEYTMDRGIELYPAQEEAVLELFDGKNVILATPTGSGKSLVALALCFMALAEEKTAFYTAPVKALVNEKFFDLCKVLGADNVGLMTGDASVNADAPVVCATAEIVSSMALREGTRADVDYVVMDEFHFYSDHDRGNAWQIPLLAMEQTKFLLMSATLGDTSLFEESITELNGAPTALVKTDERPVPLDFEYRLTPIHETIDDLLKEERTPIYIVHFTQRGTAEQAQALMSIDFLSKDEKKAIKEVMKGHRLSSPFGKELRRWLPHGVGVHHAGMLPKYRLLVEKLAQKGMLRIICGTDTLGVGVNVPIRTVLFTKLCKYDGQKTDVLSVRDFKQIAGRAGRKGFDDAGSVVAQAPAHVIENEKARRKAGGDPKKLRKIKKSKPPERGYAHWDQETFEKLQSSEPERLVSRFEVDTAMVLNVLSRSAPADARPKAGCDGLRTLIERSHEARKHKFRHGRRALQILRSLRDAGIVEVTREGAKPSVDLQDDFSLNQSLSLWVVEALTTLEPEEADYPLDVLSFIEASLENPGAILRAQLNTLKGRAVNAMKADGIEYDERMAKLEEIELPKPRADLIYATFEVFAKQHPWVGDGDNLRPKSIARDLFELGASFNEYVKEYGLQRSEGVLLRYLSNAYKALIQTVPDAMKTEELRDLEAWLKGMVKAVDSSLIDEWERLTDPNANVDDIEKVEHELPEEHDITQDRRAFTVMIRNAVWRVVRALASRDLKRLRAALSEVPGKEEVVAAIDGYFEEHERILTDPEARSPKHLRITEDGDDWLVEQTISDPADHHDFKLRLRVDRGASIDQGRPALQWLAFERL
jgi:superfamily II RNA helicase